MINVRLAVRPVRVGFVVKYGDFDGLWKAVSYNTCLWGGRFNPVVPVRDADLLTREERGFIEAPLADYLVRAFDVDLLEPLSDDPTCKAFAEARPHLRRRLHHFVSDAGTANEHLVLLDVLPALFGMEASSSEESPRWAIPPLALEGWRANFFRVMCGNPDGTVAGRTTLRTAYRQLRPNEFIVRDGVPLPLSLISDWWPIDLSEMYLHRFRPPGGWSNPGVFVGDAMDFDDLVTFWNLRAAGNRLLFVPVQALNDAMPLARLHVERLTNARPDPWDGPTVWRPRGKHEAAVTEVRKTLTFFGENPCDGHEWNGLNIKPVRVARDWSTTMAHQRDGTTSAWLHVQLPELAFDKDKLGRLNNWQEVALDVDMSDFTFGDERVTLKMPPLPRMNALVDRVHRGARVKREHVSFFTNADMPMFDLWPVTFASVLKEVLAHCGFEIKDSVPGKYSRRILEMMGGVAGCRVLKLPGVRKLLRNTAARRGIEGKPARTIIEDRDLETRKPSFLDLGIHLDGEKATPDVVLRHLVKKGVLRPGIALECPKCEERTWYAIARLRKRARCECCGAISGTEARIGDHPHVQFRVAPLWVKADVQFGVIPVILSLWRLEEPFGWGAGRYQTSAELKGHGIEMEVDFLGLIEERDKRPMLLVGECKSTRERKPEKMRAKLEKLKKWYDAVEAADVKACIAFVTTEREFDPQLLVECETMIRDERRVLLLTARELDPYQHEPEPGLAARHTLSTIGGMRVHGVARYLPELWKKQEEEIPKTVYRRVERDKPSPPEGPSEPVPR